MAQGDEFGSRINAKAIVAEGVAEIIDLAVLCANCHRLAHSTEPPLTVEAMKSIDHVDVVIYFRLAPRYTRGQYAHRSSPGGKNRAKRPHPHARPQPCKWQVARVHNHRAGRLDNQHGLRHRLKSRAEMHRALQRKNAAACAVDADMAKRLLVHRLEFCLGLNRIAIDHQRDYANEA